MKSIRLICIFCCVAGAMGMGATSVANASESSDSRRSSVIAASSGVSLEQAEGAVSEIKRKVPGTAIYSVRPTGGTRPLFDGNCLILTERAAFKDLEIGDIVVFQNSHTRSLMVHRILERRGDAYVTKGDKDADELVTPQNYQARLYGVIYTERSADKTKSAVRKNLNLLASN